MNTELQDKVIATLKTGKRLVIHNCSICGYPCAFNSDGYNLYYDSGCDCTSYGYSNTPNEWSELDFYLDPQHGHIPKLQEFVSSGEATVREIADAREIWK